MAVITISRKLGSGGDYVAEQVAETLGYHFVDKEFIARVLGEYGLVTFDREYDTIPGFWERFDAEREKRRETMVRMLNRAMQALARHGNVVILGRSGFAILEGFADVLNVQIEAPLPFRVQRLMEQRGVTAEQAEAIVEQSDRVRSDFIKWYYGVEWDSTAAFDLVIDTSKFSPELAIASLVGAVRGLEEKEEYDKSTTASIEVDSVLDEVVHDTLGCTTTHR